MNEQTDVETEQQDSSDSVVHDVQQTDIATAQHKSSDSVDHDVKPLIRFKPHFDVTFNNEPIVILDSEDEEQHDVKPVIKFTPTVTVTGEPIVISSDSEPDKDNINANSTVPQVSRQHRIKHDQKYSCYLCDQQFQMQASFLDHFETDHTNDKYKYEFCESYFDSPNGLFKHEQSHLYLKYKCDVCQKIFQFPYQLAAHNTQHTSLGKHKCSKVIHRQCCCFHLDLLKDSHLKKACTQCSNYLLSNLDLFICLHSQTLFRLKKYTCCYLCTQKVDIKCDVSSQTAVFIFIFASQKK